MTDRDERIEEYYHHGTRELAEWVVDLEDEVKKLKAGLESAENFQAALEAAGVDNWEGYGEAWARFDAGDF